MRRHHVQSASELRHFAVVCMLGISLMFNANNYKKWTSKGKSKVHDDEQIHYIPTFCFSKPGEGANIMNLPFSFFPVTLTD